MQLKAQAAISATGQPIRALLLYSGLRLQLAVPIINTAACRISPPPNEAKASHGGCGPVVYQVPIDLVVNPVAPRYSIVLCPPSSTAASVGITPLSFDSVSTKRKKAFLPATVRLTTIDIATYRRYIFYGYVSLKFVPASGA